MSIRAEVITANGGHRLTVTVADRQVELPPFEHMVFYVGLAALVQAGLVEVPIALALGVGHLLIDLTRRPGLVALGEALEEA